MRDPRARLILVGLILAFPLLMVSLRPRGPSARASVLPVLAVEAVLAGGLVVATRERTRLAAERTAAAAAPARAALPRVTHTRPARKAHAWRS